MTRENVKRIETKATTLYASPSYEIFEYHNTINNIYRVQEKTCSNF